MEKTAPYHQEVQMVHTEMILNEICVRRKYVPLYILHHACTSWDKNITLSSCTKAW